MFSANFKAWGHNASCTQIHLLLSLSSWLEEKSYTNCGSDYRHLAQGYDSFKTEGILRTVL